MNIQVYAERVAFNAANNIVSLEGVDLNNLVAEINTNDLLEALQAHDQFSTIHDWVLKELADNKSE